MNSMPVITCHCISNWLKAIDGEMKSLMQVICNLMYVIILETMIQNIQQNENEKVSYLLLKPHDFFWFYSINDSLIISILHKMYSCFKKIDFETFVLH